jgi:hypothetical protein
MGPNDAGWLKAVAAAATLGGLQVPEAEEWESGLTVVVGRGSY